ncbi:hypothetical protein BAE44_0012412 [Dichanthelium oligosanthes]|uniref:KIB1-4 beta-propeller domain-containing protein n=1 Tax=Dichanthelium oligosanthes TaxID=888268 RepID=A0A1E5VN59_9POAL|nr:hypothetical protein BAE44_0012412 [Dichanthelium oligosanthes]
MPEDPPQLFNCALSAPAPTAPGCIVVLGLIGETYLRYCGLGDETWSQIEVTFDDYVDVFDGAVAFHGGKIHATTNASYSVVVEASSAPATAALHVERTDIKIPARYPNNLAGAWREVDGVEDTTLFVGVNCLAVSPSAREEGTDSNSIHILRSCYDGVRVFTFSLADMTIKCSFMEIEEDEDYDEYNETNPPPEIKAYWSVPSNCSFKFELSRQPSSEGDGQEKDIVQPEPPSKCPLRWSSLPTDLLVEHVVPKLSFIDFLHLKSVCKDWSGISTPIGDTKAWPLLVTPSTSQSRNGGSLDVFDPVTKNKYTLSVQVPSVTVPDDLASSLMLHCSKNGWLVVSRGHSFLVNPFKRGDDAIVVLPPVNELFWFKGISFCSTPGSPDFVVMIIEGISNQDIDTVRVRTWRPWQESWEEHEDFDCEVRFLLATQNPLFLDGEFYCMTRDGKLGAFNPKTMAWRVLDGLAPARTGSYVLGGRGARGGKPVHVPSGVERRGGHRLP